MALTLYSYVLFLFNILPTVLQRLNSPLHYKLSLYQVKYSTDPYFPYKKLTMLPSCFRYILIIFCPLLPIMSKMLTTLLLYIYFMLTLLRQIYRLYTHIMSCVLDLPPLVPLLDLELVQETMFEGYWRSFV